MYLRQSKAMITKHSTMKRNHLERDWPVQLTSTDRKTQPHTFFVVVVVSFVLLLVLTGWLARVGELFKEGFLYLEALLWSLRGCG